MRDALPGGRFVRISADARQYGARTTDPRATEHFQAGIDYERRRQRDLDRSAARSAQITAPLSILTAATEEPEC